MIPTPEHLIGRASVGRQILPGPDFHKRYCSFFRGIWAQPRFRWFTYLVRGVPGPTLALEEEEDTRVSKCALTISLSM